MRNQNYKKEKVYVQTKTQYAHTAKNYNIHSNKGITLIALVITVILLLILTGVAIKVSIDGKLFGRAQEAVNKTNYKVGELQGEVDRLLGEWDEIENGTLGGTTGNNTTGGNTSGGGTGDNTTGGNTSGGGDTTTDTPPEVGAYVNYTPKTAENYVIHKEHSGEDSDQSIPQTTNLKWKVLKTYEDGRIELIAATPTDIEVKFQGALGVNNGVYILNDLCKAQYSNADYGAVARSLDLEDIENRMTAEGITAKNNAIGYSKTFSGSDSYAPDIYDHVGKSTAGESLDYYKEPTTATSSQKGSLSVTNTLYTINQIASYYDSAEFYNLIFGFNTANAYWLASRYAFCGSGGSSYACFGLRLVSGTGIGGYYGNGLFNSYVAGLSIGSLVRPVVTLGAEFRLTQVEGSSEWQIVHK